MTNLRRLTDLQIKTIFALMDCKGHPLWELAEILDVKKNDLLTKVMYPLLSMEIIEKSPPRPTTRPESNHPNKKEIPYVISTKMNILDSVWWCMMAKSYEYHAKIARIHATSEASDAIPKDYVNSVNEMQQKIRLLGKQMEALTILRENLQVLLEDKSEYLDILEKLRLSNLPKKKFKEIFTSLELQS